jgi:hypothetical protein
MSKDGYKRISLYDASVAKRTCKTVRIADFASPEELDAYVKKIREEQRVKNKQFREGVRRERIETVLGREIAPVAEVAAVPVPDVSADVDVRLDPNTGNTIVIYGSSKRGKTSLMMHLYNKYFRGKDRINTLFSGNPHLKMYKGDKQLLISYGFNKRSENYVKMQHYVNVKTKNRYLFTDLFDDIIDQKSSAVLNSLVLTYRNANISSIICLQYVYLLSKGNRSSVNHTFVFGSNTAEDTKNIIDALLKPYLVARGLMSYAEQVAFYTAATANHGFIYLDNIHNTMSLHRLKLT